MFMRGTSKTSRCSDRSPVSCLTMDIPPTSRKKREIWGTHHHLPLSETIVGKNRGCPISRTFLRNVGGTSIVSHAPRFEICGFSSHADSLARRFPLAVA